MSEATNTCPACHRLAKELADTQAQAAAMRILIEAYEAARKTHHDSGKYRGLESWREEAAQEHLKKLRIAYLASPSTAGSSLFDELSTRREVMAEICAGLTKALGDEDPVDGGNILERFYALLAELSAAKEVIGKLTQGGRWVVAERARQIEAEGFDAPHDAHHADNELIMAAALIVAELDRRAALAAPHQEKAEKPRKPWPNDFGCDACPPPRYLPKDAKAAGGKP